MITNKPNLKLVSALISATLFSPAYVYSATSAGEVPTGLWQEVTADTIGETEDWSNKVELADVNGDGLVDILIANGGNYDAPGEPEASRVFLNQGAGKPFKEATQDVFGTGKFLTRAIKVHDLNGDGNVDLFLATTYQTQSQLYLGDGKGGYKLATEALPAYKGSFGDAAFADVDGDGDLDIALADWGPGNPMENEGGRGRLWLNDGQGKFSDATDKLMPTSLVKFSWELDFADVDNDYDLDLLVAAKKSDGSFLFINDGKGKFTDVSDKRLPQYPNNYDFAVMDVNGDGFVDVATVNDGEHVNLDDPYARRDHVFLNDGQGGFVDATDNLIATRDNPGVDDNLSLFLDFDSDGDPDLVVASLSGPDRLLINDGSGHFHLDENFLNTFTYTGDVPSLGTLGMAMADLNGDHKLDVVESQGEVAYPERVYFGKNIAPDSAPPHIINLEKVALDDTQAVSVHARIHDSKRPSIPQDWQSVSLHWSKNGKQGEAAMQWYGEYLWRAEVPEGASSYHVCAVDAAGNKACSLPVTK